MLLHDGMKIIKNEKVQVGDLSSLRTILPVNTFHLLAPSPQLHEFPIVVIQYVNQHHHIYKTCIPDSINGTT